jgi:hypothetical protein
MAKAYTFRDLKGIGRVLKILLAVAVILGLASLASTYLQLLLIEQVRVSEAEAEANDARQNWIALLVVGTFLTTAVVFGMWIYRAHANLHARGARNLRVTPGWAVGYFFIPILSLWKPYEAMKDLWRASQDLYGWHTLRTPILLPLWWMFWLSSIVVGHMSQRLAAQAGSIPELYGATWIELLAASARILLCITAYVIVQRIGTFQARLGEPGHASADGIDTVLEKPA